MTSSLNFPETGDFSMAKLEDQVTPSELLQAIRAGARKNELIKKYRSSDGELASMLHPLFRSGKMSAGEFNDFFKGVPLRQPQPPASPAHEEHRAATNEDLPPSQIVESLSKTAPRAPEPAPEPEAKPSPKPETKADAQPPEPPPVAPPPPPLSEPEAEEAPVAASIRTEGALPGDSAGVSALLDMIFTKLNSIDGRLAEIERKLGIS